MLSLFRTNQFFTSFLLLFYAALVHASVFIIPDKWQPSNTGVWSDWVYQWIDYTSTTAEVLAIVLLFFQATLLNLVITQYRMAKEISLFPGLFYILVSSFFPDFLHLSPILMGNTFYIMALYELYGTYKQYSCADKNYNIGFWIAVGSLFYFSFAFFIIWGWLAMGILRAFKTKERIMMILGFLTPYAFALTHAYWFDRLDVFLQTHVYDNLSFFSLSPIIDWQYYIYMIVFAIFIMITILSVNTYNKRKNIQVQKNISILYWGMVLAALTVLFQANLSAEHFLILAVPLGVFLSFNFISMSSQYAEVLHMLLLAMVLLFQFQSMLVL